MNMSLIFLVLTTVHALDNGLARTPPMGWISWAKFFCEIDCVHHPLTCISENLYMDMADAMVAEGYLEAGYTQVNIDDCWMEHKRGPDNRLVPDRQRFSHGIKWLSKYMHERGLELGIYEDFGSSTCGGYPGSLGYITWKMFVKTDAETFASWDVDMVKFDGCNVNVSRMPDGYPEMARALNSTGHAMVYSCEWPFYTYWLDHKEGTVRDYEEVAASCNLWRNYHDIAVTWDSISDVIDYFVSQQDVFIPVNGPGHWNDPDMIVVGNTELTLDQSEAQMAIWSIWSAPLLMSNDLRYMTDGYKAILVNKKVIAVDQDPLGVMGRCVFNASNVYTFVKPMTPYIGPHYSYAIAFLNKNADELATVNTTLGRLGLHYRNGTRCVDHDNWRYVVEDLYKGTRHGILQSNSIFTCRVNPTGVCLIKATIAPTMPAKSFPSP